MDSDINLVSLFSHPIRDIKGQTLKFEVLRKKSVSNLHSDVSVLVGHGLTEINMNDVKKIHRQIQLKNNLYYDQKCFVVTKKLLELKRCYYMRCCPNQAALRNFT